MHKTLINARFISASPKFSIKPLTKTITSVFEHFYKQFKNYHDKCRFFNVVYTKRGRTK